MGKCPVLYNLNIQCTLHVQKRTHVPIKKYTRAEEKRTHVPSKKRTPLKTAVPTPLKKRGPVAAATPVYSDGTPILDCFGDHALHCKDGNALRTALWHGPIIQQFISATHLAQVPGTAGPVGAMLTSGKRPDVMVTQPGCRRILADSY